MMNKQKLIIACILIFAVMNIAAAQSIKNVDYQSPPMYLLVTKYPSFTWTDNVNNQYTYTIVNVNIKKIDMKNWKGVPVNVQWQHNTATNHIFYNKTVKTDSNGDATFVIDATNHSKSEIDNLEIIGTSPVSGRQAIVWIKMFY